MPIWNYLRDTSLPMAASLLLIPMLMVVGWLSKPLEEFYSQESKDRLGRAIEQRRVLLVEKEIDSIAAWNTLREVPDQEVRRQADPADNSRFLAGR